jgi:hypothetical protein
MGTYSLQQSQLLAKILILLEGFFFRYSCPPPIQFHDRRYPYIKHRFHTTKQKIRCKNTGGSFYWLKCWILCGISINIRFMPAMLTFNILTLNLRILLANYYKTKVVDPSKILFSFLMDLTCEYNNVQNHYKSIGWLNPCFNSTHYIYQFTNRKGYFIKTWDGHLLKIYVQMS